MAEKTEAKAEEQKEIEPCCFCPEPAAPAAAAEVAPPTAKVAARPRVEAPGKADTVKIWTKVVGGDVTKEKAEVTRYSDGDSEVLDYYRASSLHTYSIADHQNFLFLLGPPLNLQSLSE